MKKVFIIMILLLIGCSSTKNTSIRNNTNIEEIHLENQELKEEIASLKREVRRMADQQRDYSSRYRKGNQYPETLNIWIKIKNGKIHSNKIGYYNLPGRIVFDNIRNTSNSQSIIYLKSTHTNARWYFYSPRKDGEYNITAYLLE